MLQYQQAYQACAQMIQTSSTMFNSLITASGAANHDDLHPHISDQCARADGGAGERAGADAEPNCPPARSCRARRTTLARMAQVNQLNAQMSASQQYRQQWQRRRPPICSWSSSALTVRPPRCRAPATWPSRRNNSALTLTERQNIAAQLQQLQQHCWPPPTPPTPTATTCSPAPPAPARRSSQNGNSVSYIGNDQVNQVQISPDQSVSAGDSGSTVFMNMPAGNGTFTTAAGASNTGSGLDRHRAASRTRRMGARHLHHHLHEPDGLPGHQQRRHGGEPPAPTPAATPSPSTAPRSPSAARRPPATLHRGARRQRQRLQHDLPG